MNEIYSTDEIIDLLSTYRRHLIEIELDEPGYCQACGEQPCRVHSQLERVDKQLDLLKRSKQAWQKLNEKLEQTRKMREELENTEWISWDTWDRYAKLLERECLNKFGKSHTYGSIAQNANSYCLEIRDDNKTQLVKPGWRKAMKDFAYSVGGTND